MIFILTGEVGSGKTSFLRGLVDGLRASGISLDGFLCPRVMTGGETEGYDLLEIREEGCRPFLRRTGPKDAQKIGPYFMLPDGLARANEIIRRSRAGELLIVDEIGPLEVDGGGLWPAAAEVLLDDRRRSLVVIRESLLPEFRAVFAGVQICIFGKALWPELLGALRQPGFFSVKVKFFAYFRELFAARDKDMNLPSGSTLRALLEMLADTPARRAEIFAGSELKHHIVIMINGAAYPSSTGLDTLLAGGDVVAVFPMMGGG